MLAGALLLGLAIGPMYPLLLTIALRQGEAGNVVFVMAGCGASLLPLLTGLVSKWSGSLRIGLGVPLVAATVAVTVSGPPLATFVLETDSVVVVATGLVPPPPPVEPPPPQPRAKHRAQARLRPRALR